MADIPEHLKKEHVLEIQEYRELSIHWGGWPPGYDGARRRRIIKRRMVNTSFAVNMFEIKEKTLIEFGINNQNEFENNAVIDGSCFARAFYNALSDTGKIKTGQPVVFDTSTGRCVTGINQSWQPSEYTVVGTALADYSDTDKDGQDIPIKLSSVGVPGEEGTGVLLYTSYRLPGRYLYNGEKIAGYFSALKVRIELETESPNRYKLVTTDEEVAVIHPGRRDVRPHMYIWAQKISQDDAPVADLYIVTTTFYE